WSSDVCSSDLLFPSLWERLGMGLFFKLQLFRTAFFENFIAIRNSLAQPFLLFFRKMYYFNTFLTTTVFHFHCTFFTLNKKQMAGFVGTIGVRVARFAALVAVADY